MKNCVSDHFVIHIVEYVKMIFESGNLGNELSNLFCCSLRMVHVSFAKLWKWFVFTLLYLTVIMSLNLN